MLKIKLFKLFLLVAGLAGLFLAGFSHPTALAATPPAYRIADMPVYAQEHYLSCEFSATRAAVARWGVNLSEGDFINSIPRNDNPHLGFRGYIDGAWGWIDDYGIYAEPIARYLATKGFNTKLIWGGAESLKEEIAAGRPVVVWIIGEMGWSDPIPAESEGVPFTLAPAEHAMTVYGYDEKGVYVADPAFGSYDYYWWDSFLHSWSILGNMAMSVWPADQGTAPGERPGIAPEFYRYWLHGQALELIGQPLAPAFQNNGKIVQYFERTRLEYDPAQPPAHQVSRGLLGRELTATRQEDPAFVPLNPTEKEDLAPTDQDRYFPETGFLLDRDFADYWQNRGGLEVFGFPISRAFTENGLKVQYFERARLEIHSEGPDKPAFVLSGLLGRERLAKQNEVLKNPTGFNTSNFILSQLDSR